jgi:hypothetical protein
MAPLTAAHRNRLAPSSFAIRPTAKTPGRYPIHDRPHAANALARVSQHGSPSERATVRRAVCGRFPSMPTCKR